MYGKKKMSKGMKKMTKKAMNPKMMKTKKKGK
jgi:hypothetical protein